MSKSYKGVSRWVWLVWLALIVAAGACLAIAIFLSPMWQPAKAPTIVTGRQVIGTDRQPIAISTTIPIITPIIVPTPSSSTLSDPITQAIHRAATEYPSVSETIPPPTPKPLKKQGNLAIIIDDMGGILETTQAMLAVAPPAVTMSFFPFAPATYLVKQAHASGHTIMLHTPMQPQGKSVVYTDGGRLYVGDSSTTITTGITNQIKALQPYVVGANNHMGSAFTQWQPGMELALQQLDAEGLFFLDSLTTRPTATRAAAQAVGFSQPLLARDVFLDHTPTETAVTRQFLQAVHLAQTKGHAIAIGHPLSATIAVLARLLPTLTSTTGVTLVPITALLPKN